MFMVLQTSGRRGVFYHGTVAGFRAWLRAAAGGAMLRDWLRVMVHN